jgi:hypothetical protein
MQGLDLCDLNLIVGKNSTGKTNAINRIVLLSRALSGEILPEGCLRQFEAEFSEDGNALKYTASFDGAKPTEQRLFANGREEGISYDSEKLQAQNETPLLDKLRGWASRLSYFDFASSNKPDLSVEFAEGLKKAPMDMERRVLELCRFIGYDLDEVKLDGSNRIYVVEPGVQAKLFQSSMSQGMIRALALIARLAGFTSADPPSALLIDDIGEGLDFDRSTRLIKLLSEYRPCQLIMSTNDRYIMNSVPLENWQIVRRVGSGCKVLNYRNSKELFEDFKYTGLASIDILATDFLDAPDKFGNEALDD